MTRILDLPLLSFSMLVRNNEDWLDSWAYLDAAGAPISLDGLVLRLMVRAAADDPVIQLGASTLSGAFGPLIPSGLITTTGNVLGLSVRQVAIAQLELGDHVFEVQAQGDGYTRDIATGQLNVQQGVVR